jgi:hypothetical protein
MGGETRSHDFPTVNAVVPNLMGQKNGTLVQLKPIAADVRKPEQ